MLELLSYFGMICLLLALALRRRHLTSDLLNLVGGMLITVWSLIFQVWAFVILNSVWSILSAYQLIKDVVKK